jgi:hypothetical protein
MLAVSMVVALRPLPAEWALEVPFPILVVGLAVVVLILAAMGLAVGHPVVGRQLTFLPRTLHCPAESALLEQAVTVRVEHTDYSNRICRCYGLRAVLVAPGVRSTVLPLVALAAMVVLGLVEAAAAGVCPQGSLAPVAMAARVW